MKDISAKKAILVQCPNDLVDKTAREASQPGAPLHRKAGDIGFEVLHEETLNLFIESDLHSFTRRLDQNGRAHKIEWKEIIEELGFQG